MIVIEIGGGLCNQLYGFLNIYFLAKKYNQEIKLFWNYKTKATPIEFLLDTFQIPDFEKVTYTLFNQQEKEWYDEQKRKSICLAWENEKEDGDYKLNYCRSLKDLEGYLNETDDFWIIGFWCGDKSLLKENKSELNSLMQPRYSSNFYRRFLKDITGKNVVGVHIRRGEFVNVKWTVKTTADYQRAAIQWYKEHLENCQFYIFTNDIPWAKTELGCDSSYHYISCLGGTDGDIEEFLCLMQCQHKILANSSTFSSLAYDLNDKKKKSGILYKASQETSLEEQILLNEKEFLFNYADLDVMLELTDKAIEKRSASYQVDGVNNGVSKEEAEQILRQKIESKEEAVEWLRKCDEVTLNVYAVEQKLLDLLKEKKMEALYIAELYAEADLLAYRISFQMLEKKEFVRQYAWILRKNNDDWAALIEAARYQYLFEENCGIVFQEAEKQSILNFLMSCKRYSFLVYTSEKGVPFDLGKENIAIGLLLRRMGNAVSFMHKEQSFYPHRPGYIDIAKASSEYTIIPYGIKCKCSQFLYTDADDSYRVSQIVRDDGKERVALVSTFDSFADCIHVECKKIVFWYNESTKEEKVKTEDWLEKQSDKQLHKKVVFVRAGKKEFVTRNYERVGIESFYKKEQYLYELGYKVLQELEH